MVWRAARVGGPTGDEAAAPARLPLRLAAALCGLTCVLALTAAGGEIWRFALMLRGRSEVLSGRLVRACDAMVRIAGIGTVVLAVVTAVVLVPVVVRLHTLAARRAGLAPSRPPASVLARLVVPGWNLYGVGVLAGEIDGLLAEPRRNRPRLSRLVAVLWVAWVVDAVLVVVTLGLAFGTSDQAVADTVQLHIAVDLAAAAVAGLWAVLLLRFRRALAGEPHSRPTRWVVQPPAPTRGPRQAAPTRSSDADAAAVPEALTHVDRVAPVTAPPS